MVFFDREEEVGTAKEIAQMILMDECGVC